MTNLKILKQMIKEPASKEWFAKYGSPKSKHMKTNPLKEALLKKREARKHVPTEREKEVHEVNERSRISNMTPIWKDRHERRHGKKSKYDHSLKGRLEHIKRMSAE